MYKYPDAEKRVLSLFCCVLRKQAKILVADFKMCIDFCLINTSYFDR